MGHDQRKLTNEKIQKADDEKERGLNKAKNERDNVVHSIFNLFIEHCLKIVEQKPRHGRA